MKPDDFERQLEQQPLRALPPEWRHEVLRNARRAAGAAGPARAGAVNLGQFLRELLWPAPRAWAALAGVWVIIACINYTNPEPEPPRAERSAHPRLPEEMIMAIQQQRRLSVELLETPNPEAAPAETPERPRTSLVNVCGTA